MLLTKLDYIEHFEGVKSEILKHNPSYPSDYQKIDGKTETLVDFLNVYEGRNVVDFGSNFGMFTMLITKFCKHVYGIERDPILHASSLSAKSFLERKGFEFNNLTFVNGNVFSLKTIDFDSILLSLVLYHLSDDEVLSLLDIIKKKVKVVLVQCRPSRGELYSSGVLPDYGSANKLYGGLFTIEDNISFLRDCGFNNCVVSSLPDLYYGEDFPLIYGEK